jgi:hypothetical protein
MVSFYYKVGSVETTKPWYLPKFDTLRDFFSTLVSDDELRPFKILLHGSLLYNWNSWSIDLFLELEGWQFNLDLIYLERIMSKIYRIAFDKRLLVDVTFCGNHQYSDIYQSAKQRGFFFPAFNNSEFIKFNHIVKTVDGKSTEKFLSSKYTTVNVSENLVKYNNLTLKYQDDVINRFVNEKYIFKEGISIDLVLSLLQNQFEIIKRNQDWGVNLNIIPNLNVAATASFFGSFNYSSSFFQDIQNALNSDSGSTFLNGAVIEPDGQVAPVRGTVRGGGGPLVDE